MALAGAELLLYPTAIGWEPADDAAERARQLDAWRTVQRGHAVANNLPVLCANRHGVENAGQENHIEFWGNSFICGPQGEMLAQADTDGDCHRVAELDLSRTESLRRIWPFLRDRRIDAYAGLLQRALDTEPQPHDHKD